MNKEQIEPLIAERNRWFMSPACRNAEWYWALYILENQTRKQKIVPFQTLVSSVYGVRYDVWAIQKTHVFGQQTKLIIDPFPGIIVGLNKQIIRPLLPHPLFIKPFRDNGQMVFSVHVGINNDSSAWYMDGMTKLLEQWVDFPIDTQDLRETMQTFQQEFKPLPHSSSR